MHSSLRKAILIFWMMYHKQIEYVKWDVLVGLVFLRFTCPACSKFFIPAGIYKFKVNDRNTRARCEKCSKLTTKTPKLR